MAASLTENRRVIAVESRLDISRFLEWLLHYVALAAAAVAVRGKNRVAVVLGLSAASSLSQAQEPEYGFDSILPWV